MTPASSWSVLVDVKWVSRYLGIAEGTVRELARRGQLKAIRVGRSWRFDRNDLEVRPPNSEPLAEPAGETQSRRGRAPVTGSLTAALAEPTLDESRSRKTVESVIAALSDPETALPDGVRAAVVRLSDNTFVLRTAPGSTCQTTRALLQELARALARERDERQPHVG